MPHKGCRRRSHPLWRFCTACERDDDRPLVGVRRSAPVHPCDAKRARPGRQSEGAADVVSLLHEDALAATFKLRNRALDLHLETIIRVSQIDDARSVRQHDSPAFCGEPFRELQRVKQVSREAVDAPAEKVSGGAGLDGGDGASEGRSAREFASRFTDVCEYREGGVVNQDARAEVVGTLEVGEQARDLVVCALVLVGSRNARVHDDARDGGLRWCLAAHGTVICRSVLRVNELGTRESRTCDSGRGMALFAQFATRIPLTTASWLSHLPAR